MSMREFSNAPATHGSKAAKIAGVTSTEWPHVWSNTIDEILRCELMAGSILYASGARSQISD
jgi:hypothetical protein